METLQIPISNARKAYEQAEGGKPLTTVLETLLGKEAVTPRPVIERIKTWEAVLAHHNTTQDEFDDAAEGLSDDEVGYRMCKMVAVALNEGWTPDWSDSNQAKYWPWMEYKSGSGFSFASCVFGIRSSTVGSRLCFKTSELAIHYGKHFADVINKFFL